MDKQSVQEECTIPVLGWHLFKQCMEGDVGPKLGALKVGESFIFGPDIIHEAVQKVRMFRDRLATAYRRQKSYANNRKRSIELEVGDQV